MAFRDGTIYFQGITEELAKASREAQGRAQSNADEGQTDDIFDDPDLSFCHPELVKHLLGLHVTPSRVSATQQ